MLDPQPAGVGRPITDRAAWEAYPNKGSVRGEAERELKEPIPALGDDLYLIYSRAGSRKEYEIPYQRRTKRLSDFTLAECFENQGRFLPAIEAELDAILSEKTWTLPAHDPRLETLQGKKIVDLGAAMRSWDLATVDYLLGDKLKPETRTRLRGEVDARVLQPYKADVLGQSNGASWMGGDNNWNAVCHAGVIGSALALVDKPGDRAWYLAAMEIFIRNYLSGFTADGYCSEGMGYWDYGFGHYVLLAETVGAATRWGLNLYEPPIVAQVYAYPSRIELFPDVNPAFSDNDPSVKSSKWIFEIAGPRIPGAKAAPRSAVSGVASHSLAVMLYQTMIQAFSEPPAGSVVQTAKSLALRDLFSDAGVVVCRPADAVSGRGLAIAIKAGNNNEHHNHNDIGSYVIALDGRTPLLDPGAEVYTSRTFGPHRYDSKVLNSYGHSVPLVAGHLQDTGAAATGTITVEESTDSEDRYLLDLKQAYAASVPSLKKLLRHLRFVRSPSASIEISDEVEFDSPQSLGDALITFGQAKSLPDGSLLIDGMQVKIDTEGQPYIIKDEVLEENLPSGRKARRIGLSLSQPILHARITYHIAPAPFAAVSSSILERSAGELSAPTWAEAVAVEAEKFSAQTGGAVETVPKFDATGGVAVRLWNNDGHQLSWKFHLSRPAVCGLVLRYCNGGGADALRSLSIDGHQVFGSDGAFSFPPTGGWSENRGDWREVWLAKKGHVLAASLSSGDHVISLCNTGGGPMTLDWISLVPLKKPTL